MEHALHDTPHDGAGSAADAATAPEHAAFAHTHLARLEDGLDFVNTLEFERGGATDALATPEAAIDWLRAHDLMHTETRDMELARIAASPAAGARLLERIRRVREAMRELIDSAVERRPPSPLLLAEVNRALRTHYVYELVPAADGVSLDHRHEGDPIEGALARLAESVAREVSQGGAERLRVCANETCRWVFNDTSRTGRKKWCDMATCGNRAKAARHRERARGGIPVAPDVAGGAPAGPVH